MKRLFLFNPENDMALVGGSAAYTPTRPALEVGCRGQLLPWWLGDQGDCLLVRDIPAEGLTPLQQKIESQYGPGPRLVANCRGLDDYEPVPWGWSRWAASLYVRAGLPQAVVDALGIDFDTRRSLSHRGTAVVAHSILPAIDGVAMPDACVLAEAGAVVDTVAEWGRAFVKTPWSSSGRGVWPVTAATVAAELPKIAGAIRRQGSVIVQKWYEKAEDFAMLYEMTGGSARFVGYSMFYTDGGAGAYGGNRIMTDEVIAAYLGQYFHTDILALLRDSVGGVLAQVLGQRYQGPVGVDMLVYKINEKEKDATPRYGIAPFIEINLRYTMGFVAHAIAERHAAVAQRAGCILNLSDGFMGLSRKDLM